MEGVLLRRDELRVLQEMRRARLALQLTCLLLPLNPYVDIITPTSTDFLFTQTQSIAESPLGKAVLHLLGSEYIRVSRKYQARATHDFKAQLRGEVKSVSKSLQNTMRLTRTAVSAVRGVVKLRRELQGDSSSGLDSESINPTEHTSLVDVSARFVDLMWYLVSREVRDITSAVAKMVLYEINLTPALRMDQCRRMSLLGKYLRSQGEPFDWGKDHIQLLAAF